MFVLLALTLLASPQPGAAAPDSNPPAIPAAAAAGVFARAQTLCQADAGRLWGVSLCVPLMIADAQTRQAVTNRPALGALPDGDMYRLTLPADVPISTAPAMYGGAQWAQLMWPMDTSYIPGADPADTRDVLLMHESFHVIQSRLGFRGYSGTGSISGVANLDTQAGRVWLRGELHALRTALLTSGEARRRALRDALAMRLYRNALATGSAEQEREQDVMEGLAEGTGIDAGLPPNRRIPFALADLAFVEAQPSYARSFPYGTGPAYTELLDAVQARWRRAVTPASDVAHMALHAYKLTVAVPGKPQAEAIIARYGGAAIESQEQARAARKAASEAKYTRELVEGSTIALPMVHFNITFNPREVEAFAPHGSVYHTVTVSAPWGTITVSGGDAMISQDFSVFSVVAPADTSGGVVHGNGWTLNLTAGYAVVPDPQKPGSFTVSVRH